MLNGSKKKKVENEDVAEPRRAYNKAWNEEHKDKRRALSRAYYKKNKSKIQAYNKAWSEAHKEERKAYNKAWSEAHKEERKTYYKKYNEEHKEEKKAYNKARKVKNSDTNLDTSTLKQKRQKRNSGNESLVKLPSKRNEVSPTQPTRAKIIKPTMIHSGIPAVLSNINPELNFPEKKNVSLNQLVATPPVTSTNLFILPIKNEAPIQYENRSTIPTHSLAQNKPIYRNSLFSSQLFFSSNSRQTISLGEKELGRSKLPSEEDRMDNFINSLIN